MRRMSSVNDVMNRLNQITECSICTDTFQDPRVLPCIHTYCLRCLQSHGDRLGLGPGQKMPCPLCRDEFLVPENGYAGLRKNFFMSNLIEMSLISNPIDRDKFCEICLDSGDVSQLTTFLTYHRLLPLTVTYYNLPLPITNYLHLQPLTTSYHHLLPLTIIYYHLQSLTTPYHHFLLLTITYYHLQFEFCTYQCIYFVSNN